MNYKNLIKIALKALANNKFRGFLTMLGIIIGVASVIAMLAIGQGSKRSIREQISEMGSNMIMVHPGNGRFGGVRQSASSMQTLKLEDYRTIEREASYISACSPTVSSSGQAIYGANKRADHAVRRERRLHDDPQVLGRRRRGCLPITT